MARSLFSGIGRSNRPARIAAALCVPAVWLLAGAGSAGAAPVPASADVSREAFERFKALAGSWIGASSKGWTEEVSYRVIANGSAVLELSFDAHPEETMVSMIHPDGDRLLLTHYCAARNQPRLVLTRATRDLAELTFEFLDGTNLTGRDQGHMDKVVWRFTGPDEFSSQWTWYQDGQETWMEDIRYVRAPAPVTGRTDGEP